MKPVPVRCDPVDEQLVDPGRIRQPPVDEEGSFDTRYEVAVDVGQHGRPDGARRAPGPDRRLVGATRSRSGGNDDDEGVTSDLGQMPYAVEERGAGEGALHGGHEQLSVIRLSQEPRVGGRGAPGTRSRRHDDPAEDGQRAAQQDESHPPCTEVGAETTAEHQDRRHA